MCVCARGKTKEGGKGGDGGGDGGGGGGGGADREEEERPVTRYRVRWSGVRTGERGRRGGWREGRPGAEKQRERERESERERDRRNARARAHSPVDKPRVFSCVRAVGCDDECARAGTSSRRRRRREVILDYRLDTTILGADQRPTAD